MDPVPWPRLRLCGSRRAEGPVPCLRADLAENPLTNGVISSEQAMRGYEAAMDAALGRSSQTLTEWFEGFR